MIPEGGRSLEQIRQAVGALRELQEGIRTRTNDKAKLSDTEVKAAIDEGRR